VGGSAAIALGETRPTVTRSAAYAAAGVRGLLRVSFGEGRTQSRSLGIEALIHIPVDREEIYLRKRQEHSNASDAPSVIAQPQRVGDGTPGRLAHRFRVGADSFLTEARQRPSEREAVIRLSAMASTLNWAASEIEAVEGKFRQRGNQAGPAKLSEARKVAVEESVSA